MKGCPLEDGRFKCCAIDCPILTKFAMELIKKKLFDIEKEIKKKLFDIEK